MASKKAVKAVEPKAPAKMGRPSIYTDELAALICKRLAEGESLRTICSDKDMPHIDTVCTWQHKRPDFAEQYARAREKQADFYAESIVAIADETEVITNMDGEDVVLKLDATAVARNRLRMDARKWYASKLAPKKYGDKIENTVQGPDGGPVNMNVTLGFVEPTAR
jgi:hypothetical protein